MSAVSGVPKRGLFFRVLKRIGYGVLILFALFAGTMFIAGALAPDMRKALTPAGFPVNQDRYIRLENGESVWISVWLPENLKTGEKIPALVETSRYGQQLEAGWLYRAFQTLLGKPDINKRQIQWILDRGYTSVWIQSPGSCQSTGIRRTEYPPEEIETMRKVGDWVVVQPWSNGRFGAFGTSYSATTSDMMCATGSKGAKAVYAKAPDFDVYTQLIKPGGVGSNSFIQTWGSTVKAMDEDNFIGVLEADGAQSLSLLKRLFIRGMVKGLQRPTDSLVFEQALRDHRKSPSVTELAKAMVYKTPLKASNALPSLGAISLYNYKKAIEQSDTFMYTRVGWFDAGVAEGALEKYLTMNRPQRLVIQPSGHVFSEIADPFKGTRDKTPKELKADREEFFQYFDSYLKGPIPESKKEITYYTYGLNQWRKTKVWPPENIRNHTLYFSENNSLAGRSSKSSDDNDAYKVDFTTTTGAANRWMTQMGRSVRYENRSGEDKKLLSYTSSPMKKDVELTGSPTLVLYLSSSCTDGAFHAYLEDVAPDGRVSYLTEGMLRGIFRKAMDPSSAPFVPLGVYHTYSEADAEPMAPGKIERLEITLFPISTLFKAGHRIRISLAGHDASLGTRYPGKGTPVWHVQYNSTYPSHVILPLGDKFK